MPDDVEPIMLAPEIRAELRSLSKPLAATVARHLVMAGRLVESDPELALAHAREARRFAARIGVVREAAGITAYRAGEWAEALTDLRAAQRLTGDASHLPLIADSERALGRPERALRIAQSEEVRQLDAAGRAELRIVAAGARRDLGEFEAALLLLRAGGVDRARVQPWSVRLWYAYADTLLAAGRVDEAADWFLAVASIDSEAETDAEDRLVEIGILEPVEDTDTPASDAVAADTPAADAADVNADAAVGRSAVVDGAADADVAANDTVVSSAAGADTTGTADSSRVRDLEKDSTDSLATVEEGIADPADEADLVPDDVSDEMTAPTGASYELPPNDETVAASPAAEILDESAQPPAQGTFSDQIDPQPRLAAVSKTIPQVSVSAAEEPVPPLSAAPPPVSTGGLFQEPVANPQSSSVAPQTDNLPD